MRVYIAAYALLLGLLAYLGLSVAGLVFTAIFGLLYTAVIVASALWRDAPRRRWFWLAGTLPALIFFGPDLGKIAGLITQPSSAVFLGLLLVVGLGTLIVAAVASYRDARQAPG